MTDLTAADRIGNRRQLTCDTFDYLTIFPSLRLLIFGLTLHAGADPTTKSMLFRRSTKVIERCLLMTTDPGDLVLDPTCGSGTTAYVAEQWGRRWITCDTSRVALALARTRLMAAKYPYYSAGRLIREGHHEMRKSELTGKMPPSTTTDATGDIRKGFVYKRVPHVTLKSIANNPDIKEGMTRAADRRGHRPPRRDRDALRPALRRQQARPRQRPVHGREPSARIARSASRRRSSWPKSARDGLKMKIVGPDDFATMILDNLARRACRTRVKGERLKFDSLDPYAGEWIHAAGEYTDADGKPKRGPPSASARSTAPSARSWSRKPPRKRCRASASTCCIVCGFAFDPSVSEEAKRYGKLTVLPTRMNPDLAMGDELLEEDRRRQPVHGLRRAGRGDQEAEGRQARRRDQGPGRVRPDHRRRSATPRPTTSPAGSSTPTTTARASSCAMPISPAPTNPTRSSSAPCGPRSTKPPGAASTARPAARSTQPETGKIAVKVINHYGDEVLKVFEV